MATMFAGIPLEGSGIRPLDADLYGADQQPVDYENLSATGNLNIGNVLQYDAHTARHLEGASLATDNQRNLGSEVAPIPQVALPESNGNVPFTRALASTEDAGNSPLGNLLAPTAGSTPPGLAGTPSVSDATNTVLPPSSQSSTQNSSNSNTTTTTTSSTDTAGNTTYNTYNTSTTTTTTNDTTETHSLIGDHTLDPLVPIVGDVLNSGDSLLNTVVSTAGDTVNTTNSLLGDTLGTVTDTVGGVLGSGGGGLPALDGIVDTVTNTVESVLGGNDLLSDTLGTVTDTVGGILGSGGGDLPALDGIVDTVTGATDALLSDTSLIDTALGAATALTESAGSIPILGEVTEMVTAPILDTANALLSQPLLDANAAVLTSPFAAAGDHALINTDLSLLSSDSTAVQTAGDGLIDLSGALLSTDTTGSGVDALALAINPEVVAQNLLPDIAIPPIELNTPLPTDTAIPLLSPATDSIGTLGQTAEDLTSSLLDPSISFDALSQTAGTIAVVDAGVLFNTDNVTLGGESAMPAPVMQSADLNHVATLIGGLFGHH